MIEDLEELRDRFLHKLGELIMEETEKKFVHKSGATSGSYVPNIFIVPYEGDDLVALRFLYGNQKHEDDNPLYAEANWLKAYRLRDVNFFRERGAHAIRHLKQEMRGIKDLNPGGNLGGALWFCYVMAFIEKNDPFFYGAIIGRWNINNTEIEAKLPARKDYTTEGYIEREKSTDWDKAKIQAAATPSFAEAELRARARESGGIAWEKQQWEKPEMGT